TRLHYSSEFSGDVMEEKLAIWGKSMNSPYLEIYDKMNELFNNKYLSDIIISINGIDYHCHKSIICQTQELKKLIGDKKLLKMESGFESILEYLYSGKLSGPIEDYEHILPILEMSLQFDLQHLYESLFECIKAIRDDNILLNLLKKIRKNAFFLKRFIRNIKFK